MAGWLSNVLLTGSSQGIVFLLAMTKLLSLELYLY